MSIKIVAGVTHAQMFNVHRLEIDKVGQNDFKGAKGNPDPKDFVILRFVSWKNDQGVEKKVEIYVNRKDALIRLPSAIREIANLPTT